MNPARAAAYAADKRFLRLLQLQQEFWTRLRRRLVEKALPDPKRPAGPGTSEALSIGDIVVLLEKDATGQFPLGRITEKFTNSSDGVTRVYEISVAGKRFKRAFSSLCRLCSASQWETGHAQRGLPALGSHQ